jgi:hypothetical protein
MMLLGLCVIGVWGLEFAVVFWAGSFAGCRGCPWV